MTPTQCRHGHSLSLPNETLWEAHQTEQLWLTSLSIKGRRRTGHRCGCEIHHQSLGEGRLQARRHLRGRTAELEMVERAVSLQEAGGMRRGRRTFSAEGTSAKPKGSSVGTLRVPNSWSTEERQVSRGYKGKRMEDCTEGGRWRTKREQKRFVQLGETK